MEIALLEVEITEGMKNFMAKHNFETTYQAHKACGLGGKTIETIIESGRITATTLYKLGCGVGYKGKVVKILIKVLKDFEGK
jgi:hypothetical protein